MIDAASAPVLLLRTFAPLDQTVGGRVLGSWLLAQIDVAAGVAGPLHVGSAALMISVKELNFRAPLAGGSVFEIWSTEARRGRTSFELDLRATAGTGQDVHDIWTARLAMIAVDEDGKPREIQ